MSINLEFLALTTYFGEKNQTHRSVSIQRINLQTCTLSQLIFYSFVTRTKDALEEMNAANTLLN